MRFKMLASAISIAVPFMLLGAYANATEFGAKLVGFEELPAVFSHGSGTLDLHLNRNARTITFKLTFSGLSAPATASHIHFGKRHVGGGVTVFFCGGGGRPPCPSGVGTVATPVTGTIMGANVIGLPAQALPAGDFDALVAIIESDTAYANVHTTNFPGGEIRGQIRRGDRDDDRK